MKPIFTVHAGEFLVGQYIAQKYKGKYEVWLPAKDIGVDLLVTHRNKPKPIVKIQVKHSRSHMKRITPSSEFAARGWYTIRGKQLRKPRAEWWVFVISPTYSGHHYIIIPRKDLKKMVGSGRGTKVLYLSLLKDGRCFNTRGLTKGQTMKAIYDGDIPSYRDWSPYVEAWSSMLPKR